MQWLYEAFYSAIGELFADINDLGVEIFDLSWVQAVVSLFTMLGWSLFVVGVVVAVFEVAIESQSGRVNIKGTALNVLKGFFGASEYPVFHKIRPYDRAWGDGVLPDRAHQYFCVIL